MTYAPPSTDRRRLANMAVAVAVAIAVLLVWWQSVERWGPLGLVDGDYAWLYWWALVVWAGCVGVAIRIERRWWVLATAPFVLAPAGIVAVLIVACLFGNCV